MSLEQLMGRYFRLKQELAIVRKSHPWHKGLIERLENESVSVAREIDAIKPMEPSDHSGFQRVA